MTKETFKNIYDQHVNAIRNYIYYRSGDSYLTDDITQETFIKVWEKRKKLNQEKITPLLYTIAAAILVDHFRKQKHVEGFIEEIKFRHQLHLEESSDKEILKQKCELVLKALTEKERVVFLMSRKDELSYKEIALRLELSIKAVEKRMTKALKKIKQTK